MLTEVQAGPYTVRGISVGGVYTSLQVPELGVVLDVGVPLRSFATTDHVFLSHGHSDHASALGALLGIRGLVGKHTPARVFLPAEIESAVQEAQAALCRLHRSAISFQTIPMLPGETLKVYKDLWVRAFRTHHAGPSLGYQFLRRITKLKPEHQGLPGEELARLRREGAPGIFEEIERRELAYATDTLSKVLETAPEILDSRVLILECTYLDQSRTVEETQERLHVHLDEIIARADRFQNEALVLMHFSQAYPPTAVHDIIRQRVPPALLERVRVFAPDTSRWFG
ncbi:MBL fold metallo-hydrolase [Hyalangium rubrum]|uniref:MBL fold metallo-hydrolase n=1 Tax=Hyalangium rubrum TaxID=3103134 RepID=A0ABU5HFR6_9BACT|nr:MBL fold metallo-hydrolase [Hyalangium sp. s54d21]MDY7231704.1 MBL fold metallo-hydrolase [Hyalangium sp. s54d21]